MKLDLSKFPGRVIATREISAREATYAPFPAEMHPALQASLRARGIESMYSHQAESFVAARGGENLVITTGTASGKSVAYLSPVMQSVLDDPTSRSLLLFPTKALTQDQLRGVLGFIDGVVATGQGTPIQAGVYDGDTPPAERTRIRDKANLILTNPDMGSYGRDRGLIRWALHSLYAEVPVPEDCLTAAVAARLAAHEKGIKAALPKIPWDEVERRFTEVVARLREGRVDGAEILVKAAKVEVRGHRLVITFASAGLVEWLRSDSVQRRLWPAISAVVFVPKDGSMTVEVEGGGAEKGLAKAIKLRRRHDDLTGGNPDSEGAANDTLAGGYQLAKDLAKPN